ncbi:hypothetical protein G7092_11845 [Mucilaginibacter sp. HC2]|uniref:hypothetical protein n=1 Tax=Mucilaginibacter inviolabilis TaxID=2714892 RepID=UPI00140AB07C|nr:hypothetical protein [Mucilaginibacter inviolabilis]NHA04496.1 hypothetical protein [Mucilaginibacter inviolabilis]
MSALNNVWYLSSENTRQKKQVMAMDDIGILNISPGILSFRGTKTEIVITEIISISYGKQGRDFINNWVKVEYYGSNGELSRAYFADGNNRGWSGIFGGTKNIFKLLKEVFSL